MGRERLKKPIKSFTMSNMAIWAGVDDVRKEKPHTLERNFIVDTAELLLKLKVIEAISKHDYRLTPNLGIPFIQWVITKGN